MDIRFDELEVARQSSIKKKKQIHILFGFIALLVGVMLIVWANFVFMMFGGFAIAAIWYYFIDEENKKFGKLFKLNVMVPSLLKRFPNMSYQEKGISEDHFVRSELYKRNEVDRYSSEDEFRGTHGKTKFRFSEVHVEQESSNSDGGSSYTTIFQGVFMIADFNKSLNGKTRVIQASDNFFKKIVNRKTQVALEYPDFEKVFNTYSDDQIEARYILSTAMMERILNLQAKWREELRISFIRDHVFIAINHKQNLFEPNMKQEINHLQLRRIHEEVEMCLEIIDALDLNTRIWTKE